MFPKPITSRRGNLPERHIGTTAETRDVRWRRLALVFAALILFAGLGSRGLNEPDEGRYAEEAREMLVRMQHDSMAWLEESLDGQPYYSKPPLTNWLTALSMHCFGLNEWAARFPSALAAFATVVVVTTMVRRFGGERWAALTAVMLPTTGIFFVMSHLLTTDMILCFFITSALAAFWRWYEDGGRRHLAWWWLALAGGMMTKGPVGVAVPLLVVVVTMLVLRKPRRLLAMGWWWGVPLFEAVGLPWFLMAAIRFDLWSFFLKDQVAGHYLTEFQGRVKPFWFYFVLWPFEALPWTPLALASLWNWRGETARCREQRVFLSVWMIASLIFFSGSHTKLPAYILPAVVPAALLAARFFDDWMAEPAWLKKVHLGRLAVVLTTLVVIALPILYWRWLRSNAGPELLRSYQPCVIAASIAVAIACLWGMFRPTRMASVLITSAAVLLVAASVLLARFEDAMYRFGSLRGIALQVREHARLNDMVVLANTRETAHGLNFYTQRLITKHKLGESPAGMQHPTPDQVLRDTAQIGEWAKAGRRVFCVVPARHREKLSAEARTPMQEVTRTRQHVLMVTATP